MTAFAVALKNIRSNGFRSFAIFLCVAFLSGCIFATTLLIRGASNSLNRGIERLGADILVVPAGAESRVETALLVGRPTSVWMPKSTMDAIAGIPGVDKVTPQIYLQSLFGSDCCSVSEMFIVVYDPETDFVLEPWLRKKDLLTLNPKEAFGGTYVFVPPGQRGMLIYGSLLTLRGNFEATGTGLDQSLFITRETADILAKSSISLAMEPLVIPADSISAVLVKVSPSANAHKVALDILKNIPRVAPIESPNLFGVYRQQMGGLLWGFFAIMLTIWALSLLLIGLVFSMAANERRREIAVLRATGATRAYAIQMILAEAGTLALGASVGGTGLAFLLMLVFKDFIAGSLRIPFLIPSFAEVALLALSGVLLSLVTVTLAALAPAMRITGYEPAIAMRE
jgi:putative ABC transport system permease protein